MLLRNLPHPPAHLPLTGEGGHLFPFSSSLSCQGEGQGGVINPLPLTGEGGDNDAHLFKITVQEQIQRMDAIVQHQLRRAIVVGHGPLGRAISVAPLIERLTRSLGKVYRDKAINVELNLAPEARFFGDEADFLEILGNIVDNAFKYGRNRVKISTRQLPSSQSGKYGLQIDIEDNGSGIDPVHTDKIMQRGLRLDESIPGEGIGLSVAKEIVTLYGGHMKIGRSTIGGACLTVYWPPA